jgi:hypothetical protein
VVSGEPRDRFGLGRPRPVHEARAIRCASCGSPNAVKDEAAKLVVCGHCGNHLDLSGDEQVVLGEGRVKQWAFPLELGERFRFKGVRHEVIARMAHIEDGDYSECTRDYLLYHPSRGSLWLSEYGGSWSWSRPTHVMPAGPTAGLTATDRFETGDGRRWVVSETGEYELLYVDGSLPWTARIGDRVRYVDCVADGGSDEQYEITEEKGQREFGRGAALPISSVRRALGRDDVSGVEKSTSVAEKLRAVRAVLGLALVALVINGGASLFCWQSGSTVLDEAFTDDQMTAGAFSSPFTVPGKGGLLKIRTTAIALNNDWMAANLALVEGEETVAHVLDADMEYYTGRDADGSWSEGSRSETLYVRVPRGGSYRVLVQGISAHGNDAGGDESHHGMSVRVQTGARLFHFFVGGSILAALVFLFALQANGRLAGGGDDDD